MSYPWLDSVWREFHQRLVGERLPHGLLLSGPAGTGKLELAVDMAALLLCLQPGERACGECRSCRLLVGGAHPDRFEVLLDEGKHQIRIDQVRNFLASLVLTTTISARKVAVIAPAEAMNRHAANALLKNLEEPPGDTVLILVSNDLTRLPVTVRSRCQALAVSMPPEAEALAWLQSEAGVDADVGRQALLAAAGSPLAALTLHQQGLAQAFQDLRSRLVEILGHPGAATPCATSLADLDPEWAWNWLSLNAAEAARGQLTGDAQAWPGGNLRLDGRRLARLQQQADRNRALATTAVRQDLLLQEWLLEWAGQPLAKAG